MPCNLSHSECDGIRTAITFTLQPGVFFSVIQGKMCFEALSGAQILQWFHIKVPQSPLNIKHACNLLLTGEPKMKNHHECSIYKESISIRKVFKNPAGQCSSVMKSCCLLCGIHDQLYFEFILCFQCKLFQLITIILLYFDCIKALGKSVTEA